MQKLFSTGEFKQTGNPLDMAIEGKGFFQVLTPSGELAYTRDGAFKTDSEGRLVTSDGYLLQPEITIPADYQEIVVGVDGTVSVVLPGQNEAQQLGQIQIVGFSNPAGLSSEGHNLYRPTASSGDAVTGTPGQDGLGGLASGILEMSNVQVVEEMVNMIVASAPYGSTPMPCSSAGRDVRKRENLRQ